MSSWWAPVRYVGRIADRLSPWIAIGLILIGFLTLQNTKGHVREVEHKLTEYRVELCSTSVSCHALLEKLIANFGPQEAARIRARLAHKSRVRHPLRTLSRELVRTHRVRSRRHVAPHHASARHRSRKAVPHPVPASSAPPVAAPQAVVPPPPSVPVPVPPAVRPPLIEPPRHEPPGQTKKEGPLRLPCVELPVAERILCRPGTGRAP